MTRDPGVVGSSLTAGTVMCHWARHFILCLALVQPRKTHPDMTGKNCWLERKEKICLIEDLEEGLIILDLIDDFKEGFYLT